MNQDSQNFAVQFAPMRLRFGCNAVSATVEELARFGSKRAVVLSSPGQSLKAQAFASALGEAVVGCVSRAIMHTPVEVTAAALTEVQDLQADALVAYGGGSTIGLSKALALRTGLRQIAVPTTYAGSEVTSVLGQTEQGRKTTITDPSVQPQVIFYDPSLITALPAQVTVTSGLNAMAHAVEALYARDANPLTTTLAMEGLRAMVAGLPQVLARPSDLVARSSTQYGAFLCGLVLGQVGMSLHHKLCHVLGGSFGLAHAETHSIILPHAVAYNEAAVPGLLAPVAALLNADRAGPGLYQFARALGAPTALEQIGLKESDLDRAVEIALQNPYWNPRPLTQVGLRNLLQSAWAGRSP